MLLQFFIDEIQKLKCRSDSQLLMMHARNLREQLVRDHWPETDLPKLIGTAGRKWFQRWRSMYNIVKVSVGLKLKVSWKKVQRRVGVLMRNIFRLRAFWKLLFHDLPMRWLSIDQKPSWFNNAGHTGAYAKKGSQPTVRENFQATRQRYTILTSVPSWRRADGTPPKVAVLFKGKPDGRILRSLAAEFQCPPWMITQVQENGSYRSEDVVAALDWMLPAATRPEESIVVLLDWYSGHRTDEVEELLRRKGHVLLFHGGGTTPFTQVNDTHLHASVARLMIEIENEFALAKRRADVRAGLNKTPTLKRPDILDIVKTMWLSVDHTRVATKGYRQTGPEMPLEGPICRDDVFADLAGVLDRIAVGSDPVEMCTRMRDESVAYVREGYNSGKWTCWADCHMLVEEHDAEDDPAVEGMEAFGFEPADDDDENGEDGDGDGDDDGGGSGDPDGGNDMVGDGGGALSQPEEATDGAGGPSEATDVDTSSADVSEELLRARLLLYEDAKRTNDDLMLRHLRQRMSVEKRDQRDANSEAGMLLRKRARETMEAEAKRRKADLEAERLAANEAEKVKLATARAHEEAAKARLAILRQVIVNRRDSEAKRHEEAKEKAYRRWLQTEYPSALAARLIAAWRKLPNRSKATLDTKLHALQSGGILSRVIFLPKLWENDDSLTVQWGQFQSPVVGGGKRWVRCSLAFLSVIDKEAPRTHFGVDPCDQLLRLFAACSPRAKHVFSGPHTPARLLLLNDCVVEKAFCFGIIALSKWLGEESFPQGVYGTWPPLAPFEHLSSPSAPPVVSVDGSVPSHVPAGAGSGAASSGGPSAHG